MSFHVEASRLRLAVRCAALAMISAGIAGCSSDMTRFERPGPLSQSNIPPTEVTGSVPMQTAPTGRVESQPLPGSYQSNNLPAPPPRYSSAPQPYPAAPPPRVAAAPRSAPMGVHTVGPRESLVTIAKKYRKTPAEIARANGLKRDARVRVGQRIAIPGVPQSHIHSAAVETPAPSKPTQVAQAPAKPAAPTRTAAAGNQKMAGVQLGAPPAPLRPPVERVEKAQLASPAADPVGDAQPATTGAVTVFRWPVRGRVITGFGPKANGQQNDGINLAVPEGTSVKAAEDGVVAYSGNELKGYGNLVLVRHSNGFVTAYAHASELKVKRGEQVKRGQIIALAGQTGNVSSPQLHFEIRKGSTPVDPMPHLSGN